MCGVWSAFPVFIFVETSSPSPGATFLGQVLLLYLFENKYALVSPLRVQRSESVKSNRHFLVFASQIRPVIS